MSKYNPNAIPMNPHADGQHKHFYMECFKGRSLDYLFSSTDLLHVTWAFSRFFSCDSILLRLVVNEVDSRSACTGTVRRVVLEGQYISLH